MAIGSFNPDIIVDDLSYYYCILYKTGKAAPDICG